MKAYYVLVFFLVNSLKCKCDPCHSTAVNETCESSSKCFTAVRVTYEEGKEEYYWTYGCFSDHHKNNDGNSVLQVMHFLSFQLLVIILHCIKIFYMWDIDCCFPEILFLL